MSDWTKEQRAIAAAHLCDIIALTMRTAGVSPTTREAHARTELIMLDDPASERWYRSCLAMFGAAPEDIDAAVSAIARSEHPPDSLPGRLEEMRGDAHDTIETSPEGSYVEREAVGSEYAYGVVLDLLGCKVPE